MHTEMMPVLKVKANLKKENPTGVVDFRMTMSGSVPVLQGQYSIGERSYNFTLSLHPFSRHPLPSAAGDRTKGWGTIINDPTRGDRKLQSQ